MKGKFVLNYKLMASIQDAKDESSSGTPAAAGPGRPRSVKHGYLHDHRTRDAIQEYRESLPE